MEVEFGRSLWMIVEMMELDLLTQDGCDDEGQDRGGSTVRVTALGKEVQAPAVASEAAAAAVPEPSPSAN